MQSCDRRDPDSTWKHFVREELPNNSETEDMRKIR